MLVHLVTVRETAAPHQQRRRSSRASRGQEIAAQMSVYEPWTEMARVANVIPSMT